MIRLPDFYDFKVQKKKITCVAVYDATMSTLASEAGIDVLLVGDSLGMLVQGHKDTLTVSLEDMVYHTRCVSKGNRGSFVIADMPFGTNITPIESVKNASRLIRSGANMVKVEGGLWLLPHIESLLHHGIPVCGHLGLTPQSSNLFGGYKVQAKTEDEAAILGHTALEFEKNGLGLLVLECIPRDLAESVTKSLKRLPVIGIGAGSETDGQILVSWDLLGASKKLQFTQDFLKNASSVKEAFRNYIRAVENGSFPNASQSFS